jgi:tRNA-dihydrouridine synthase B
MLILTPLKKCITWRRTIAELLNLTDKKLWLAPLAGYTDQPFRRVCKEWGADVAVSEMVSADGIIHKQRQTLTYLDFTPEERPFGIQLFGSDPLVIARAVDTVMSYQPDFLDLNMGCPVKKVVKRGAGGALMADLNLAVQIVKEAKKALPAGFPLSAKFRSGTDFSSLNYLDFGKAMQDAGADFVILHPRTVKQVFSGSSNWGHIAALKQHLSIPVVGNGDVRSVEDGLELFRQTGCDSIMLGRGVLGHPWLFASLKSAIREEQPIVLNPKDKLQSLFRHLEYFLEIKPERLVVREIRAHLCFYTKGLSGGAKLRDMINHTENLASLKKILTEAFAV